MSPVRLELQRGDIVSMQADVCVSSLHVSKDLTIGPLPKHILKCGGPSVQAELLKREPEKQLKIGQVEVVSPGKLQTKFKELNFICLCSYQPGHEEILLQSILECLELAAVGNHKSVAFPALGVGYGYPAEKVAACLVEAVSLHNCQYPQTTLDIVYVVLLDQHVDLIKTFLLMCVRGTTDLQAVATGQPPSYEGHDLDDSMTYNQRSEATQKFGNWNQHAHSGANKSGTQRSFTPPPQMPKATGQKKSANQPPPVSKFGAAVIRLLSGIGYSGNVGYFNYNIKPKISPRTLGVQVNVGIDISFIDKFIPASLRPFWQTITS